MEVLNIEQLSDILEVSIITSTIKHASMLIHTITHPTLGAVTTIQGDDGGLLFTRYHLLNLSR